MRDPFHESKAAYEVANICYTSVGSLSGTAVYSTIQACENALKALWHTSMGATSNKTFKQDHQPAILIKRIGLYPLYSEGTRTFLDKQIEWKLHKVRFEDTHPYEEYISEASQGRSKYILEGTMDFINETKSMVNNPDVIKIIKGYKK